MEQAGVFLGDIQQSIDNLIWNIVDQVAPRDRLAKTAHPDIFVVVVAHDILVGVVPRSAAHAPAGGFAGQLSRIAIIHEVDQQGSRNDHRLRTTS